MTLYCAIVFRYDTKRTMTKEKTDKLDFLKIKNICALRESEKTTHGIGGNIWKPSIRLRPISRIHKNSYNSTIKRKQFKYGKEFARTFL